MSQENPEGVLNESASSDESKESIGKLCGRGVFGGALMGLANLVPGISGGTMLVAAGIYQRFINAIAEVTTLKFRKVSIALLVSVVCAAALVILLLAGAVKGLVVDHRVVMYSLFIGLTLGGLPVVWAMIKKFTPSVAVGAVLGVVVMAAIAYFQMKQPDAAHAEGFLMFFVAGILGASAMILPGVSGGYLLLVLGAYVPILGAIDVLKLALKARDFTAILDPILDIILPTGLGVLVGIVVVSNLLKWLLRRFEAPTLGVLLGLLVGAVVGLYPFQRGVEPALGSLYKGREVTTDLLAKLTPDQYPTEFFKPDLGDIGVAVLCIVIGFAVTAVVALIGREKKV